MSSPPTNTSTHPDFPNGTEVINERPNSRFFGQRGSVYGSGPSGKNASTHAVIWVRWPDGSHFGYFPKGLGIAPKPEKAYFKKSSTKEGARTIVHEVPAARRGRQTLAQKFST